MKNSTNMTGPISYTAFISYIPKRLTKMVASLDFLAASRIKHNLNIVGKPL